MLFSVQSSLNSGGQIPHVFKRKIKKWQFENFVLNFQELPNVVENLPEK